MNNPFLTSIIREPCICKNSHYSIVEDKEPITAGHYMVFSNHVIPSFADTDPKMLSSFLRDVFSKHTQSEYSYFERGRASFCTSMNGVVHAHGHLLPKFSEKIENIFQTNNIKKHKSLVAAYKDIPSNVEYLIWGNLNENFYTIYPLVDIPKRIIRTATMKYFI